MSIPFVCSFDNNIIYQVTTMTSWAISDQGSIGVDDLLATGPIILTIERVEESKVFGDKNGIVIYFVKCKKPFVPCLTVRKILARIMPADLNKWKGERMEIFADMSVVFGKDKVGGVRVKSVSCIKEAFTTYVTGSRGRRIPVTVMPLSIKVDNGNNNG